MLMVVVVWIEAWPERRESKTQFSYTLDLSTDPSLSMKYMPLILHQALSIIIPLKPSLYAKRPVQP